MRSTGRRWKLAAATILVMTSGCSQGGAAGTSEPAGSPSADGPMTLRIGTDDEPGRPAADAVVELARVLGESSDGAMALEPAWHAAGTGVDDWDQAVLQMVVDGELDMAVVPSRAFDTKGVTTLRALDLPFVVGPGPGAAAVVQDESLVRDLLAGVEEIGVHGLDLYPESMRYVFSWGGPLVSPGDFDGALVRAPRSATTNGLFERIGATVDDATGDAFDAGVQSGTITAAESSLALALGLPGEWTTVTGNLAPFPKVNALVVNARVWTGLTQEQRRLLEDATAVVRSWAVDNAYDEAEAARTFCAEGGTVVLADTTQMASFTTVAAEYAAELESDATTADLARRIRQVVVDVPPGEPVEACNPDSTPAGTPAAAAPVGGEEVSLSVSTQFGASESPVTAASGAFTGCTSVFDLGSTASYPTPRTEVFTGTKRLVCEGGKAVLEYVATQEAAQPGRTDGTWSVASSTVEGIASGGGTLSGTSVGCVPQPGSDGCIDDTLTGTVSD